MSLRTQLDRRKSKAATIAVVVVGVVVVGGVLVMALGGGGGGGKPSGTQDVPLIRPGYKILPNCGGVEVMDEARALDYAREKAIEAGANFKDVTLTLFGPVCAGLPATNYIALAKKHAVFLYRIQRAVLQGAVSTGQVHEAAADAVLAAKRDDLASLGVDKATLTPLTVGEATLPAG